MSENDAPTLLQYLYSQLDVLSSIDLADIDRIDAACRVNKAVNDTSRSILGVADLSIKAMGSVPTVGSRNLLTAFFEEEGQ